VVDTGTYYSFNVNMVDDKGPDGSRRQLMHGWVTGPPSPTKAVPWWQGAHSIPRVLTLQGDCVVQQPIPEIEVLRGKHQRVEKLTIEPGMSGYAPRIQGDALELIATFDRAASTATRLGLKLRVSQDGTQAIRVWYEPETDKFGVDGTVTKAASAWGGITRDGSSDEPITLHVFLDRSVLEVYCGGTALTARSFPDPRSLGVDLFAEGGNAALTSLDVWDMAPMWE
jgi:beta-fructofuranosidase